MDRFKVTALVSISLIAVMAIFLNVKTISKRLQQPFHLLPKGASGVLSPEEDNASKLLALKVSDTDQDGLSDYDELYTYRTSAYIEDTDSDGIQDGVEIKRGTDPNCPQGKDCGISPNLPPITPHATSSPIAGVSSGSSGAINPLDIQDPKQIRQLMLATGQISQSDLNQIDDATLLSTWEQVKQSLSQSGSNSSAPSPAISPAPANPTIEPIASPADLRRLLQESGMKKDMLDKIDDATLLKVYKDTVEQKK